MVSGGDQHVSLPPHYAFVVQLEADTQVETGQLHGRVEHVVSGQAARFASLAELTAFFAHVLTTNPRSASGPPSSRGSRDEQDD